MAQPEPPVPMLRSMLPEAPWDILAADHNGPYQKYGGIYVLLIVDTYSRFLVARVVKSTSFAANKPILEETFDTYGFPQAFRTDNGPPFQSEEYEKYMKERGMDPEHSWPLTPQQNGMIERYMKIVNKGMAAAEVDGNNNFEESLNNAIKAHNSARNRVTDEVPEELMFGRKLRRELPLAKPSTTNSDSSQIREKDREHKIAGAERENAKRGAKDTAIKVGDEVVVRNTHRLKGDTKFGDKVYKVVTKNRGDLELEALDGQILKRNVTFVKKIFHRREADVGASEDKIIEDSEDEGADNAEMDEFPPTIVFNRRPKRVAKPPKYLEMYVRLLENK